ncbi:hypothetical protein [Limnochorda pilosa]|uniref:HTH tetR-type domain-containing protein n=1 Tax=Limnochorda pilosa TaxID=1555112 RepID=A0A0K2SHL7_LIMPI|nr:hypothetical protein [Limnochorda pilosa]BAS26585.1 hypothetical protein LIP_0728 [Limnochorda pilosa]
MADATKETYAQIGREAAEAMLSFFGALSQQLAVHASRTEPAQVEALRAEVAALQARLERLESQPRLAGAGAATETLEAGPSEVAEVQEPAGGARRRAVRAARRGRRPAVAPARKQRRRRTPKQEVRERALQVAREMASRGELVNLKTVADAAGLNYNQITYAFGRKENLLKELGLVGHGEDGETR